MVLVAEAVDWLLLVLLVLVLLDELVEILLDEQELLDELVELLFWVDELVVDEQITDRFDD